MVGQDFTWIEISGGRTDSDQAFVRPTRTPATTVEVSGFAYLFNSTLRIILSSSIYFRQPKRVRRGPAGTATDEPAWMVDFDNTSLKWHPGMQPFSGWPPLSAIRSPDSACRAGNPLAIERSSKHALCRPGCSWQLRSRPAFTQFDTAAGALSRCAGSPALVKLARLFRYHRQTATGRRRPRARCPADAKAIFSNRCGKRRRQARPGI